MTTADGGSNKHPMANVRTCIVLGAGASFGSSFRRDGVANSSPPVMRAFLPTGYSIVRTQPQLWDFYRPLADVYGEITDRDLWAEPDLEKAFRWVEASASDVFRTTKPRKITEEELLRWIERGPKKLARWLNAHEGITPLDRFWSLIVDVIEMCQPSVEGGQTCHYHDALVRELQDGDSVISLNYDTIIERSLQRSERWNLADGYSGVKPTRPTLPSMPSRIGLIKPHGSLNWYHHVRLEQYPEVLSRMVVQDLGKDASSWRRLVDEIVGLAHGGVILSRIAPIAVEALNADSTKGPVIIPPTTEKSLERPEIGLAFGPIWKAVHESLLRAERVLMVGLSLETEDTHFALALRRGLKEAARAGRVEVLIVGDPKSVERLLGLLGQSSRGAIRVTHVANTLEDYISQRQA